MTTTAARTTSPHKATQNKTAGAWPRRSIVFLQPWSRSVLELLHRHEVDGGSREARCIDLCGVGDLMFIGTDAFGNVAGEVRYEQVDGNTIIYGDTDGDGTANFQLKINLSVALIEEDFVL